jgi:DNA mismatch repair ATPase MutS
MLASFADLVALSNDNYVKPTVIEHGPMVIRNARHPVISKMRLQRLQGRFVANDVLLSDVENFQIIMGANGAGKVTLRM